MLATHLNPLEKEQLSSNCICQVNQFLVNTLKDGRGVVILVELEVLKSADEVGVKIGNTVLFNVGHGQQQAVLASALVPAANPQTRSPSNGTNIPPPNI